MEITEVRVALRELSGRTGEQRLKAYVTLTFDHCFVVRNIKIIDGRSGLFVAMPSQKAKAACAPCGFKNDAGARFCAQCGRPVTRAPQGDVAAEAAEVQTHRDLAHPITAEFRQYLEQRVLDAYETERAKAQVTSSPGGKTREAF